MKQKTQKSIADSQVTTSELRAEAKKIEEQLNNVRESDLDERSDMPLSMMQSNIPGITKSDVSVAPKSKKGTIQNETIKEEEFDFTRSKSKEIAGRSMSHAVQLDKSKKLQV